MNKQGERVEIERIKDEIIEIRYFDKEHGDRYLGWKMSVKNAIDLAKWWRNEGQQTKKKQLPVIDYKFFSILISMSTQARVEVRSFDQYGRISSLGFSFPRKVIEHLDGWLQDGQQSQKSGNRKEAKICSEKCFNSSLLMGPRQVKTHGRGDLTSETS